MTIVQVARHDETWPLETEQRWNSKIRIKAWILGPWEGSEASRKSCLGEMMKICFKWAEIEVDGGGGVLPLRNGKHTQEKVKTGNGDGGVVLVDGVK